MPTLAVFVFVAGLFLWGCLVVTLLIGWHVDRYEEVLNSTVNIEDEADTIVSMDRNRREY